MRTTPASNSWLVRRFLIVAMATVCAHVSVFSFRAHALISGDDPSLAEVLAAIENWHTSLSTIDVRYRVHEKLKQSNRDSQMRWAEDRVLNHVYYERADEPGSPGYSPGHVAIHYDGTRALNMDYPTGKLPEGSITAARPYSPLSTISPTNISGIELWGMRASLLDAAQKAPSLKLDGTVKVDGAQCVRLVISGYEDVYGKQARLKGIVACLDSAHDYLPRKLEIIHETDSFTQQSILVTKFARFHDATLDKDMWFPTAAQVDTRVRVDVGTSHETIEINDVVLGSPLANDLFQPALPVGTQLQDQTNKNQWIVIGGEEALLKAKADEIQDTTPSPTEQPNARSSSGWVGWISTGLTAFFAAILITSAWFLWRR